MEGGGEGEEGWEQFSRVEGGAGRAHGRDGRRCRGRGRRGRGAHHQKQRQRRQGRHGARILAYATTLRHGRATFQLADPLAVALASARLAAGVLAPVFQRAVHRLFPLSTPFRRFSPRLRFPPPVRFSRACRSSRAAEDADAAPRSRRSQRPRVCRSRRGRQRGRGDPAALPADERRRTRGRSRALGHLKLPSPAAAQLVVHLESPLARQRGGYGPVSAGWRRRCQRVALPLEPPARRHQPGPRRAPAHRAQARARELTPALDAAPLCDARGTTPPGFGRWGRSGRATLVSLAPRCRTRTHPRALPFASFLPAAHLNRGLRRSRLRPPGLPAAPPAALARPDLLFVAARLAGSEPPDRVRVVPSRGDDGWRAPQRIDAASSAAHRRARAVVGWSARG